MKFYILLVFLVLMMPLVTALEEECGITNIASCLPKLIYESFIVVISAPILPLLIMIQTLLRTEVSIEIFKHTWSVIRYLLSAFYIFFFIYAGFSLITSSLDPIKRVQAKDLLKDIVIMIILINASFFIYSLILSISSVLNIIIISMINPEFFLITADNITNIGLEFTFALTYAITLFITVIMLTIRYVIVSMGVILFPIGIFCYYIPPLKKYGKFIVTLLLLSIFITFIDLLIILACSLLIEINIFEHFKILLMITCFMIVNYSVFLAIKFALKNAISSSIKDDLSQAVKYIALII